MVTAQRQETELGPKERGIAQHESGAPRAHRCSDYPVGQKVTSDQWAQVQQNLAQFEVIHVSVQMCLFPQNDPLAKPIEELLLATAGYLD